MFINLTKTEVEETITALEDLQTYLGRKRDGRLYQMQLGDCEKCKRTTYEGTLNTGDVRCKMIRIVKRGGRDEK